MEPGRAWSTTAGEPAAYAHITDEGTPVLRTHQAGTLSAAQIDQSVTLTGWVAKRRDHGGVAFIDLRDASGVVQVEIGRAHV